MISSNTWGRLCSEGRCACIAALEKVWFPLDLQVQAGFSTEYTWRPDQYETVLRSLLSAKYNAVPLQVISQKLGVDGKKIVKAMVKENLLSFRPQSGK